MSLYTDYLSEIETRKKEGLKPKPIEDGKLLKEIISQIKDTKNNHRKQLCLKPTKPPLHRKRTK